MMSLVTICSSVKQKEEILQLHKNLSFNGDMVFIPVIPSDNKIIIDPVRKQQLVELHRNKILMSDKVYFILKPDGTMGKCVEQEYEYAKSIGSDIFIIYSDSIIHEKGEV